MLDIFKTQRRVFSLNWPAIVAKDPLVVVLFIYLLLLGHK